MANKQKGKSPETEMQHPMFPPIGLPDQRGAGPNVEDEEDDAPETAEQTISSLKAQLAEMKGKLDGFMSSQEDRIATLLASTGSPATAPAPEPEIDLPNPVDDPKGFQEAVLKRTQREAQKIAAQRDAAAKAEQHQAQVLDDLWNGFQEQFPDLAEHTDLITLEVDALRRGYAARGVDPIRAMATNRTGTIERVAKGVSQRLERYRGSAGDEDDAGDDTFGTPDMRTTTIPGGTTKTKKPGKKGGEPKSFLTELHEVQRKSGFY